MSLQLDYLPGYPDIRLYQDKDMFTINTASKVLGEFLLVHKEDTILDIGTNNGALLLYAKRYNPKKYIGIDINKEALEIAEKNMELNHIDNYELIHADAKEYISERVDVIVSNMPYFKKDDNNTHTDEKIKFAKHDDLLPLEDLMACVSRNLRDNGKFFCVYQSSRLEEIILMMNKYRLTIKELRFVHSDKKENSSVVLIKSVRGGKPGLEVKMPLITEN